MAHSFEEFYDASYGRLLRQLVLVTGDRGDAEDLLQDAYGRAAGGQAAEPNCWDHKVAAQSRPGGAGSLSGAVRAGGGSPRPMTWTSARGWNGSPTSWPTTAWFCRPWPPTAVAGADGALRSRGVARPPS